MPTYLERENFNIVGHRSLAYLRGEREIRPRDDED
jgi:hypothetical protein